MVEQERYAGFALSFYAFAVAHITRRWDDDVVFKNQARGTEDKKKKEFVNVYPTTFYIVLAIKSNLLI